MNHTRAAVSAIWLLAMPVAAQDSLPLSSAARMAPHQLPDSAPPPVPREFRAVWVATVANIDWPSKPGLSTWEQQAEMLAILNRSLELNLNAIILQVRPAADAMYPSRLEPWSEYLTAQPGRAPEPFWDPLAFAVAEAHKRGLELHAWFNPYRARQAGASETSAFTHLSVTRPSLVKQYGRRLWMDPGEPSVRRQSLRVIADVVRRYDVDGVHIDDYFYPYPERGVGADTALIPFPDSASWERYVKSGGKLARDDWRRQNVDRFVREMYAEVKRLKPWVKVGISPFGIWRPGYPEQIRGFDAYTQLYADARTWLVNGWVDYFTPQLYWPIAQEPQSYPVLLRWWVEQNGKGRHIWPGNFTSRAGARGPWKPAELREQIRVTRAQPGATGNVHFSMRALMPVPPVLVPRSAADSAARLRLDSAAALAGDTTAAGMAAAAELAPLAAQLMKNEYAGKALVPATPWLARGRPLRPLVRLVRDSATRGMRLSIAPGGAGVVRMWVVHTRDSTMAPWRTALLPSSQRSYTLTTNPDALVPGDIRVSAIDRVGMEGPAAIVGRRRVPTSR